MKKKLLFVMPSLSAGGGEKSLVNLLSQIDFTVYNVDLFLFNKTGIFLNSLPTEVNILELEDNYKVFTSGLKSSFTNFLKTGKVNLAYYRTLFAIKNRLNNNVSLAEQYTWKYKSKALGLLEKEYDMAVGFLEKSSIYFIVEKVKSKKKIGWIHTNYSNSKMDPSFDEPYFKRLDQIVTVSEECARSLRNYFPHMQEKISIIYNIISPKVINTLAKREIEENISFQKNFINIITVARLSYEKGIDLAINSCKILVDKGYKIKWYVLGDGNEREKLEKLIENNKLQSNFTLLGIKENPYPFIRAADIYVQPSRYEGKSIAIDEAKILQKPIIVTNFETAKDQISNGKNGIIVGNDEEEVTRGIETFIKNKDLINIVKNNLSKEKLGTEDEIKKLYEFV